jgi:hypothetical protein
MDPEEVRRQEQNSMSLYASVAITDLIVQRGAEMLYDQYLDSILPPHEIEMVMGSLGHVVSYYFCERDQGENQQTLKQKWNPDHEEEPETPTV